MFVPCAFRRQMFVICRRCVLLYSLSRLRVLSECFWCRLAVAVLRPCGFMIAWIVPVFPCRVVSCFRVLQILRSLQGRPELDSKDRSQALWEDQRPSWRPPVGIWSKVALRSSSASGLTARATMATSALPDGRSPRAAMCTCSASRVRVWTVTLRAGRADPSTLHHKSAETGMPVGWRGTHAWASR